MRNDYINALVFFEKNGFNLEILNAWKSNHNIKDWREIGLEKPGIGVQLGQGVKRFQHWKQEQQLQASRWTPVRSPPHYAISDDDNEEDDYGSNSSNSQEETRNSDRAQMNTRAKSMAMVAARVQRAQKA